MRKVALALGILNCCVVLAQEDTLRHYELKTVPIVESEVRVRMSEAGVRTDVIDSTISRLYPAGTLSDLLGGGGGLTLKSYGPGMLSTTSVRGANSMQTPIIWNGINLQNITNNTVDLSLMPTFLFDQVSVQPGSSSAAWGSGTVGGAIRVTSAPVHRMPDGSFIPGTYFRQKVVFEYGSFGAAMGGYLFAGRNKGWTYDARAFRQIAQNNFTYTDIVSQGHPQKKLEHAAIVQHGVLLNLGHTDSAFKNIFSLRMWLQETRRELPPTMLQSYNESTQQDYALRIVGGWVYIPRPRLFFSTRAGLIHEGLLYNPGFNQPISNTDMWTALIGSDVNYFFGLPFLHLTNLSLSGGISTTYSSAVVSEFVPFTTQSRSSAFVALGQVLRKHDEWNVSLRMEMIDDQLIEPVGGAWYYFVLRDWLGFRACISHNYRVPTFNDLYWVPGGNPELKAETSWTEELTIEVKPEWKTGQVNYSVTVYNRNIDNMITWVPGATYWSPENVAEVWSRGAEHRLKIYQVWMNWKFTLLLNADYVRATYEKTDIPNDVSVGKQLIYVPAWFGGGSFTAQWRDYFVTYSHQYTDLRFTSRDHVEWLPSFSIANAAIGWNTVTKFLKGQCGVNLFVRCNNIFDAQYQPVAWRPMPGRNFMIGCTIDFAKQVFNQ